MTSLDLGKMLVDFQLLKEGAAELTAKGDFMGPDDDPGLFDGEEEPPPPEE